MITPVSETSSLGQKEKEMGNHPLLRFDFLRITLSFLTVVWHSPEFPKDSGWCSYVLGTCAILWKGKNLMSALLYGNFVVFLRKKEEITFNSKEKVMANSINLHEIS